MMKKILCFLCVSSRWHKYKLKMGKDNGDVIAIAGGTDIKTST